MSPSAGKFNDDEQWDFENDALWNFTPAKKLSLEEDPILPGSSRRNDANSHSPTPESGQLPWKRSQGYRPSADDIATVQLNNKLAPKRLPDPPAPHPNLKATGPIRRPAGYRRTIQLAGAAMIMIAGFVGYKLGSGPLSLSAPHSNQFEQPGPKSEEPTQNAQPPKMSSHVRDDTAQPQRSDNSAKSSTSAAANKPAATGGGTPTLANAPPARSESHRLDTNKIAAKIRTGVELMTFGDVPKARMIFQRVAEAGDGAGAFKLAETYDPLILRALELRGRIMPDLTLARTWYERARDLGALEAQDRISKLAQLPE